MCTTPPGLLVGLRSGRAARRRAERAQRAVTEREGSAARALAEPFVKDVAAMEKDAAGGQRLHGLAGPAEHRPLFPSRPPAGPRQARAKGAGSLEDRYKSERAGRARSPRKEGRQAWVRVRTGAVAARPRAVRAPRTVLARACFWCPLTLSTLHMCQVSLTMRAEAELARSTAAAPPAQTTALTRDAFAAAAALPLPSESPSIGGCASQTFSAASHAAGGGAPRRRLPPLPAISTPSLLTAVASGGGGSGGAASASGAAASQEPSAATAAPPPPPTSTAGAAPPPGRRSHARAPAGPEAGPAAGAGDRAPPGQPGIGPAPALAPAPAAAGTAAAASGAAPPMKEALAPANRRFRFVRRSPSGRPLSDSEVRALEAAEAAEEEVQAAAAAAVGQGWQQRRGGGGDGSDGGEAGVDRAGLGIGDAEDLWGDDDLGTGAGSSGRRKKGGGGGAARKRQRKEAAPDEDGAAAAAPRQCAGGGRASLSGRACVGSGVGGGGSPEAEAGEARRQPQGLMGVAALAPEEPLVLEFGGDQIFKVGCTGLGAASRRVAASRSVPAAAGRLLEQPAAW
jgi:hypothetical protein